MSENRFEIVYFEEPSRINGASFFQNHTVLKDSETGVLYLHSTSGGSHFPTITPLLGADGKPLLHEEPFKEQKDSADDIFEKFGL